jgi:hypothetical protein
MRGREFREGADAYSALQETPAAKLGTPRYGNTGLCPKKGNAERRCCSDRVSVPQKWTAHMLLVIEIIVSAYWTP